ncbi:MAG TPA: pilus assembly protein PilM, partial [Burkholderiaceae bacterium]|nr:pilus assembly protein PilM [Burkholderiaceae bacterium]
ALIVRELRERLGAQLDDAVVDYLPIRHDGSDATERSALAAVAPRERVLSHLHLLEKAGLEPIAIDIRPAALARLVGAMSGPSHPNVLLINFGRDRSYLTVLWGKRLMLDRQIEFGERALLAQLRESLNLDDDVAGALLYGDPNAQGQAIGVDAAEVAHTVAEILHPLWTALAGEIDKTLIYVASKTRGQSVQRVLVRGSLARHANCAQFLRRTLAVPVDVLQPLAAFGDSMSIAALPVSDDDGGMALAAGMALRRTDDDD